MFRDAEDGAVQADKVTAGTGASVLITKKNYRDLEVYAEFWASDDTNSGIYVRAPDPKMVNTASGAYEIQIWDKNPAQNYATGSLVNVASVNGKYNAAGRWNTPIQPFDACPYSAPPLAGKRREARPRAGCFRHHARRSAGPSRRG